MGWSVLGLVELEPGGQIGPAMASLPKLRYDRLVIEHLPQICDRRRFAMIQPRLLAMTGRRTGRQIVWAGLLFGAAILAPAPGRGEDQPDRYSATVKVDATADSAAAARAIARTDGQRHALQQVIGQLSGSTDLSKLPKLDDSAITNLVANFEVADEKMSTVRYLADYTFHFRPAKIRQLMRSANIAMADTATGNPAAAGTQGPDAKTPMPTTAVIVPVYRDGDQLVLWDDPNPWREAWGQAPTAAGSTKLSVPLGGVSDLTAIDAEQASDGDPQALTDIAKRNGAEEALVTVASARHDGDRLAGLDVAVKRYRLGQPIGSRRESIDAEPGESSNALFQRAISLVLADLAHGGGAAAPVAEKETSLSVTIPIESLGEWVGLRRKLVAVPGVHAVELLSLSRREAKVTIRFAGKPEQLKASLAQAQLDLGGTDPEWRLTPGGVAGSN
jgi:Uncharacterized protein conserved in bacteria (DUF2066)